VATGGLVDAIDAEKRRRTRDARYARRRFLNSVSTLGRLQHCGITRADAEQGVSVKVNDSGHAHFANLQLCASVHACPVCAAKVRNRRAAEIEIGLARHLAAGGGAEFVTFTLPHDFGDRLAPLLEAIAAAYRCVTQGRAATEDAETFGLCGSIKALEVNVGPNGWHPHLHVIMLTTAPLSARGEALLRSRLFSRWADGIEAAGYRRPLRQFVDVRPVHNSAGVAAYTAKVYDENRVGLEVARSDLKQGRGSSHRSAWALLADAHEGADVADLALWWEYEKATKGKYALRWSPGLKKRLGVDVLTDEELAQEEVGGETVAVIGVALWGYVARSRNLAVEILRCAERDGADGLADLLARIEVDAFGDAAPPGALGAPPPTVSRPDAREWKLWKLRRAREGLLTPFPSR